MPDASALRQIRRRQVAYRTATFGYTSFMRIDTRAIARAFGIAVPIVGGLLVGRVISPWLPGFAAWVHTLGAWAPVAFVAAYVAVVVLMLPAFLLIMAAGAVFGAVQGSVLAMTGALLGGTLAFLIARYLARAFVQRRVAGNPTLASIDRVVGEEGLRLVFLLRLSPAIPFVFFSYALGVTRVRFRDYVIGTLGFAPVVVTYAFYGSVAGAAPRPDGSSAISPVLLALGVIVTVILAVLVTRVVQRAISEAQEPPPQTTNG